MSEQPIAGYKLSQLRVVPVGADAALVTYFAAVTTPGDKVEHQKEFQMAVGAVWVKRNGQVMQAIKQGFLRHVLKSVRKHRVAARQELFAVGPEHVWQRRFHDFSVWTARKRIEKRRYMHRNPVMRGLVQEPEQWPWSSYRSYAFGEEGAVRINQWGEAKMKIPTQAA